MIEKISFTRTDILNKLYNIAQWHENKRVNPKTKLDNNLKQRITLATKEIRAYQTILQGLPDQELETRVKELEQKLSGSILISRPNGGKTQ